jgi:6-phosphogluconolactonase
MAARGRVVTFPTPEALAQAAAAEVAGALTQAVQDFGEASLCLAGGSTPRRLYEVLAQRHRDSVPWQSVHVFWGDERCVPPDDPASNFALAQTALLSRVPVWQEKVHRMRGEADPAAEAARYSAELTRLFEDQLGEGPIAFDVVLLGLGPDGHTASLFPHDAALTATAPCVAVAGTTGNPPVPRLTLTLPVLNAAKRVFFLVSGAEKAGVLHAILGDYPEAELYPAAQVAPVQGELRWFTDEAAVQ